jgi:hypothetical protein
MPLVCYIASKKQVAFAICFMCLKLDFLMSYKNEIFTIHCWVLCSTFLFLLTYSCVHPLTHPYLPVLTMRSHFVNNNNNLSLNTLAYFTYLWLNIFQFDMFSMIPEYNIDVPPQFVISNFCYCYCYCYLKWCTFFDLLHFVHLTLFSMLIFFSFGSSTPPEGLK